MNDHKKKAYCGPPGLNLRNVLGLKAKRGLYTLFEGRDAICVHKGRTAIKMACDILQLGPGHEVLAPSYNCGSEIDVLLGNGPSVVLYRIDTHAAIDIDDLRQRITNRTKAIYVIHYFGFPHPLEEIKKLCATHSLWLIEDCALALFGRQNSELMGTRGDVAIFSLPKSLPLPDGGILLPNRDELCRHRYSMKNPAWADVIKGTCAPLKAGLMIWLSRRAAFHRVSDIIWQIKLPGRDAENEGDFVQKDMPKSYYYNPRYDYRKMSSLTSHFVRTYCVSEIVRKRRQNFKNLHLLLDGHACFKPLYNALPEQVCPLHYPLLVESRNLMVKELRKLSIAALAWWSGFHSDLHWSEFPEACYLKDHILSLPIHQDISDEAIEYMAACVIALQNKFIL